MFRVVLSMLFAAGMMAAIMSTASIAPLQAQTKEKAKEKPKNQRIVISEPRDLKDDKDFAIQGEYEGEVTIEGKATKVGVQIVAKGNGEFQTVVYAGGLPGAGWDGKTPERISATTTDGKVTVIDKDKKPAGEIADGKLTMTGSNKGVLKKIERTSPTIGEKAPEGAVVLFGANGDEKNWAGGKLVELSDGKYLNMGIKSKQSFGSFKAHFEFRLPWMPNSSGQGRGNSGVYLQDRYEVQVLDSFGLKGENNECGGVYTLAKPSVNMCLPPMVWQTYDIDFTAAEYEGDKKTKPAKFTLLHNGVKVHDAVELKNATGGGQGEKPTPGPFQLQNHGDPLVYRNIWVVETKK